MSEVVNRWKEISGKEKAIREELKRLEEERKKLRKERKSIRETYDSLITQRKELVTKINEIDRPYQSRIEQVQRQVAAEREAATAPLRAELDKVDSQLAAIAFRPKGEKVSVEGVSEVYRRQVEHSPDTPKGKEIQQWMHNKHQWTSEEFRAVYPSGFAGYVVSALLSRGTIKRTDGNYMWTGVYYL